MEKNYHSEVVDAAYEIFALKNSNECKSIIEKKYNHFPEDTKSLFYHFADKLRHWVLYQSIEHDRKETNIRSYTYQLDEIVQELCKMQKVLRPTLLRYDASRTNARNLIEAATRKIEKHQAEIDGTDDPKKIKKNQEKIKEFRAERDHEIKKAEEERRNLERRLSQLVKQETALKLHIETEQILKRKSLEHAAEQDIPQNVALQIYSFSTESQFFTYLTNKEVDKLLKDAELGIQTKLKTFYVWNDYHKVYELKRDLHYYSILLETNLVGHEDSHSGISYLDKNLKAAFSKRLQHLDFRDYRRDALQFYSFICAQALEDGVMTKEEVTQMLALSKGLKISKNDAFKAIDEVAIETQKSVIRQHLKALFDLAISDNELHRAEQSLILELKRNMFASIKTNLSELMDKTTDIHLVMDDEQIFMQLCRLAKADDKFLDVEKIFIAEFAKEKNWSAEKIQHMAVKSQYDTSVEKDLESDLWNIYGVQTPFDKIN